MNFNWSEWLNLLVRWVHVFAGILWIGQTFFFAWLDRRLSAEEKSSPQGEARVWMVHSGGFYAVGKAGSQQVVPGRLRWFRWEAALTWLSGMVLLLLVYYHGGALIDTHIADIGLGTGAAIGLGVLVLAWPAYDLLWLSPLGKNQLLGALVSYLLLVGVIYGLTQVLSARAAYIHVGALLGTLMAANVWMRILPAQRRMVSAIKEGKAPDPVLAARAKQRSKHNTYMVVPVVFIMISNHFPGTYGDPYNWVLLAVLILAGSGAAHLLRRT
ncbi:MAG: urate hydroxylase PuuD [Candidatus Acidoferrales bacterium]